MTHVNEKSITSFDVSRVLPLSYRELRRIGLSWKSRSSNNRSVEGGNLKIFPGESLDRATERIFLPFRESEGRKWRNSFLFLENCPPPVFVSATYTPPPQGFLPARVESRLDFLGKVERVPLWAVHLVALPLHQTDRQPLLGETGIKDNARFSLSLSSFFFFSLSSPLTSPSPVRNYVLGLDPRSKWRYSYAPSSSIVSSFSSLPSRGNNWPWSIRGRVVDTF